MKGAIWALSMLAMTLINSTHHPVQAQERPGDRAEFSLEELLQLEVTSVSKKEQRLSASAAAIYVLTPEDIRRSGATSIPEALRMVPSSSIASALVRSPSTSICTIYKTASRNLSASGPWC